MPTRCRAGSSLAGVYWDQGKYQQAEPIYVEVAEARRRVLGEEHPVYLNSLNDLAEAVSRARQVRAGRAALHQGGGRPATRARRRASRHAEQHEQSRRPLRAAEPTGRRRVAACRRRSTCSVASSERNIAIRCLSRNNLALIYYQQAKYPEAEALFAEVLAVQRRVLGEEHPDTLISMNNLGATYRVQRKYGDAEPL